MFQSFATGFGLGFSLILAIGSQNAFVLRQGLRREHVAAVVAVCALSDAVLIALGVTGFSVLTKALPGIETALLWGAAAFLFAYGALAFARAWRGGAGLDPGGAQVVALWPVLATCLTLTWLNPHVWLDTVVLIGTVAADHPRLPFAAGAMTASLVFFGALGYGARLLAPMFARPGAWRVLELGIGAVMWSIAVSLVFR